MSSGAELVVAAIAWSLVALWCIALGLMLLTWRTRRVLGTARPENAPQPLGAASAAILPTATLPTAISPTVTLIVPARNEADCIERCVRSLLAQDYPALHVIAVNDRSDDDTGKILQRLAHEFPDRFTAVDIDQLPSGWFGKPHALHRAVESTASDLVCFTDADCQFTTPSLLRLAVEELLAQRLDLLTVTPRFSMPSLWERVTVPCCTEALLFWFQPRLVNNRSHRTAYANGAFLLARRTSLARIGGWRAVRREISEDLQLARLAKSRGLAIGMVESGGFLETRSYTRAIDSWNGWTRIFTGGLSTPQLAATLARMTAMFLLPLVAVLGLTVSGLVSGDWSPLTSLAGIGLVVAVALRFAADVGTCTLLGNPLWPALLAPLGRLFVMGTLVRALLAKLGLAQLNWRGAAFSAGRMIHPPTRAVPAHSHATPATVASVLPAAASQQSL
jgi:chlorobactene glucosyltransferase